MRASRCYSLAFCLFAVMIALGMTSSVLEPVDRALGSALGLRTPASPAALIAVMQGISWLGGGVVRWILVVASAALLWRGRDRQGAVLLGLTALTANLASTLLKNLFDRPRPALVPHLDHVSSWSYPSGHATSIAAIAIALALRAPLSWRGPAIACAAAAILLTDLSRVMLGVHWVSDVVGGTLLGAGVALAIGGARRRGRAPLPANSGTSGP